MAYQNDRGGRGGYQGGSRGTSGGERSGGKSTFKRGDDAGRGSYGKPADRTANARGGYPGNRAKDGEAPKQGGYRGNSYNRSDGEAPRQGGYRGNSYNRSDGEAPRQGGYRGNSYNRSDGEAPRQGGYRGNSYNRSDGEAPRQGGYRGNSYNRSEGEAPRQGGYRGKPADRTANAHDDSDARRARYAEKRWQNDNEKPAYKRDDRSAKPQYEAPVNERAPYDKRTDEAVPEEPWFLMGRNAVREAVKAGRSIDRILVTEEQDGSLGEIVRMARDRQLIIRTVDRKKLDEMTLPFGHNGRPGNHQGIIALVPEVEYCSVTDVLNAAKEKGEAPFVVLLDEILDPHNLGSIIRSACCAGAHGVVISKRRAASVTAAVAKASAGAINYMKIAKVANLSTAIQTLKDAGLWISGAVMDGTPMTAVDLTGPMAIVIGSEGEGLGKLIQKNCDHLVSIPMKGPMDSLNAAVAAAVLLFEKNRQDALKG